MVSKGVTHHRKLSVIEYKFFMEINLLKSKISQEITISRIFNSEDVNVSIQFKFSDSWLVAKSTLFMKTHHETWY